MAGSSLLTLRQETLDHVVSVAYIAMGALVGLTQGIAMSLLAFLPQNARTQLETLQDAVQRKYSEYSTKYGIPKESPKLKSAPDAKKTNVIAAQKRAPVSAPSRGAEDVRPRAVGANPIKTNVEEPSPAPVTPPAQSPNLPVSRNSQAPTNSNKRNTSGRKGSH
ncbi:hypothetical protein H632_c1641p0 [Helicosporidium sp. ATCC 50920]|nr:hypothetical protein H632_c1641p0 [Helicosporidium sp. ATCC 50920]|eukprot:KDD74025.1 hypothetical protein H632_c1641p0 [Helicosporidium sp. ATCC 50920]